MTRILGPGCSPAPARVPIADRALVLILAVELHDGAPVWVMDADESAGHYLRRPGAYYPGLFVSIGPGEKVRLDCGCRAGRSCARHNAADALRWWAEAHRRDAVREWRPELAEGARLACGAERPVCVTTEHAMREARRLGRPYIVCRDGWHREIERREVDRG